jgi:hypothetical protein
VPAIQALSFRRVEIAPAASSASCRRTGRSISIVRPDRDPLAVRNAAVPGRLRPLDRAVSHGSLHAGDSGRSGLNERKRGADRDQEQPESQRRSWRSARRPRLRASPLRGALSAATPARAPPARTNGLRRRRALPSLPYHSLRAGGSIHPVGKPSGSAPVPILPTTYKSVALVLASVFSLWPLGNQ